MFPFLRTRKNAHHEPATRRTPARSRLQLEPLEDRLAPATHVWSGAVSTLWSNPENWSSGGVPYGDPNPTLIFPASIVGRFTSTHDQPGTFFAAGIELQGNGYMLNGGSIGVSDPGIRDTSAGVGDRINVIDFFRIEFTGIGRDFDVSSGGTLEVESPLVREILISGPTPLTKIGDGRLILSGKSFWSTGFEVASGTLVVGSPLAVGAGALRLGTSSSSGPVTLESSRAVPLGNRVIVGAPASIIGGSNGLRVTGTVQILEGQTLTVATTSGSVVFDGVVFGPGGLIKTGSGNLTLAGNNTYEGGTDIQQGALSVAHNNALGRGGLKLSGGARLNNGLSAVSLPNPFEVSVGSIGGFGSFPLTLTGPGTLLAGGTLTVINSAETIFSGVLSGEGALTKRGLARLTLSGDGANTYTGTTTVNEGTLVLAKRAFVTAIAGPLVIGDGITGPTADTVELQADEQIADDAAITINESGLLRLNGRTETLGSVTGNEDGTRITLSSLIVGGNNRSTTFAGVISGPGSVTKVGTGTWTLTGHNTYEGGTTVGGGTLLVNGSLVGTVTVNAGATLGGTGTTGPVTLSPGAAVSPGGAAPGVQRVQNLAFAAGSSFVVQLNGLAPGTGYDQLDVTGSVSLNGATLDASLGFAPAPGDTFVIIKNDGTDQVNGTFAGLPQGAVVRIGGVAFHIYYDRGEGNNDVVLVRNVPPAISRPGDQTAFQNVDLPITGLAVSDAEDANLTVTLRVSHGTLALGPATGLTVVGSGTSAVTLSGGQSALNAALASLTYQPAHNYSGPDTLAVTASDGLDSTSATVTIQVKSLAEQAADLQARVNALRAAGVLNQGQANSLVVKLDLKGNSGDIGRVQAFLNEVDAFEQAGILTPAQAAALRASGNVLLTGLRRR